MALKQILGRSLVNFRGWKTRKKIIVIESDDWGSIRMPSKEVYEQCIKAGYPVNKIAYEKYDSLASEDDLELLFNLLTSFRDKNGNHPIITANCVVANPDFNKIKAGYFKNYYFELITDTFKRYPKHSNCFKLWTEGIKAKIFHPQYHGREHINVSLFMDDLRKGSPHVLFGFDRQMPGCIPLGPEVKGNDYVEATNYFSRPDKDEKLTFFLEGLVLFEGLFGYKSESIIPPNYIWSPDYDRPISIAGVKYIQGSRKMREPNPYGRSKYYSHYLGQINQYGQVYLLRNALFEPSLFRLGIQDPVSYCLTDISMAFRMHRPAIISSHRVNYVGFIEPLNRDRTLRLLKNLLTAALKYWPDIEFMTSDKLGQLIQNHESN